MLSRPIDIMIDQMSYPCVQDRHDESWKAIIVFRGTEYVIFLSSSCILVVVLFLVVVDCGVKLMSSFRLNNKPILL
jgi:hypothetical protein